MKIEKFDQGSVLNFRAGLPAYIPRSTISRVTTAPAPTTVPLQMDTGMIVALLPIDTASPIVVGRHFVLSPRAAPPEQTYR